MNPSGDEPPAKRSKRDYPSLANFDSGDLDMALCFSCLSDVFKYIRTMKSGQDRVAAAISAFKNVSLHKLKSAERPFTDFDGALDSRFKDSPCVYSEESVFILLSSIDSTTDFFPFVRLVETLSGEGEKQGWPLVRLDAPYDTFAINSRDLLIDAIVHRSICTNNIPLFEYFVEQRRKSLADKSAYPFFYFSNYVDGRSSEMRGDVVASLYETCMSMGYSFFIKRMCDQVRSIIECEPIPLAAIIADNVNCVEHMLSNTSADLADVDYTIHPMIGEIKSKEMMHVVEKYRQEYFDDSDIVVSACILAGNGHLGLLPKVRFVPDAKNAAYIARMCIEHGMVASHSWHKWMVDVVPMPDREAIFCALYPYLGETDSIIGILGDECTQAILPMTIVILFRHNREMLHTKRYSLSQFIEKSTKAAIFTDPAQVKPVMAATLIIQWLENGGQKSNLQQTKEMVDLLLPLTE